MESIKGWLDLLYDLEQRNPEEFQPLVLQLPDYPYPPENLEDSQNTENEDFGNKVIILDI